MKFALVLVTVLVAASAVPHPHMVQQEWGIFKSKHVKVYENVEEEAKRMAIFHQNLIEIEEHNKLYEQGLSTFKMGVTQFADMTSDEFMAYVNKSAVTGHPQFRGENVVLSVDHLPDSVDWRTKHILTPVKDQGPCGASWSFAATGTMEGVFALYYGELFSLSEQQLIDCTRSLGNDGCNGGLAQNGFRFAETEFMSTEEQYPYKKKEGECYLTESSQVRVASARNVVGIEENVRSAVAVQPLSVTVDATKLWQHYTGGVLEDKNCNPKEPNLAGVAVGYDSQSWIIRNSWGSSWGEGGYIRLSNNTRCGIENDAWYLLMRRPFDA